MVNDKNSRGLVTDCMIWTGMRLVTSWNEKEFGEVDGV